MKRSNWGRNLVLLTFTKALVVASAGSTSNKSNGLLNFLRAGGVLQNSSSKIPTGGDFRKRKEQHRYRSNTDYKPNIFPKADEERLFIEDALKTNFLFHDLSVERDEVEDNQHLSEIVASFEKHIFSKGDFLCKQGETEDTDYMYLIASGRCSVSIDGKVLPNPYGRVGPGSMVGELSLLYGTPRAATIKTKTTCEVYRLHRRDFDHFMDRATTNSDDSSSRSETIKRQLSQIDRIIDRIGGVKTKYDGNIIQEFKPSRTWLWTRWRGTIMQHAWKAAVGNMIISLVFMASLRLLNDRLFHIPITWPIGAIPDTNHPLIVKMQGLFRTWRYTMSVTTLLLTFYLNKAFSLWRDIYDKGTKVKGRINDISMVLACTAERDPRTGRYTNRARSLLDDVGVYCRLCHAFSWAGLIDRFNLLLTPRGLSRMVDRGVMTRSQYDTLIGIPLNNCGPQHATLMWVMARILQGMREGIIPSDNSTRSLFLERVCQLRSAVGGIENSLAAKIPLAYAQFVQVLVDIFLSLAPFALYSELGIWSVIAVGILNIFFSGMNDLAKILLDPLDNCDESFYRGSSVNMDVGVLIRKSNAGTTRWKNGLEELPFKYSI